MKTTKTNHYCSLCLKAMPIKMERHTTKVIVKNRDNTLRSARVTTYVCPNCKEGVLITPLEVVRFAKRGE